MITAYCVTVRLMRVLRFPMAVPSPPNPLPG